MTLLPPTFFPALLLFFSKNEKSFKRTQSTRRYSYLCFPQQTHVTEYLYSNSLLFTIMVQQTLSAWLSEAQKAKENPMVEKVAEDAPRRVSDGSL
jgi:hypothetical protein